MKSLYIILCLLLFPFAVAAQSGVSATDTQGDNARIMQGFSEGQDKLSDIVAVSDKRKRQVMFFMGIPLLLLLLTTVGLGVAMGVYGKPVFVAHMVCAGLSMTLALAHAVAGVVWFYPF